MDWNELDDEEQARLVKEALNGGMESPEFSKLEELVGYDKAAEIMEKTVKL